MKTKLTDKELFLMLPQTLNAVAIPGASAFNVKVEQVRKEEAKLSETYNRTYAGNRAEADRVWDAEAAIIAAKCDQLNKERRRLLHQTDEPENGIGLKLDSSTLFTTNTTPTGKRHNAAVVRFSARRITEIKPLLNAYMKASKALLAKAKSDATEVDAHILKAEQAREKMEAVFNGFQPEFKRLLGARIILNGKPITKGM